MRQQVFSGKIDGFDTSRDVLRQNKKFSKDWIRHDGVPRLKKTFTCECVLLCLILLDILVML